MKIARIIATEVVVPAQDGYVDRPAFGASIFDKKSKWILEVFTDHGLVGYGETYRGVGEKDLKWAAHQILGKPLFSLSWRAPVPLNLEGHDMFGHPSPPVPPRLHEVDLWDSKGGHFGIEVAILDLWGKACQIPLYALFGGAYREWVPTSWWFGRSDREHAAKQTEIGFKQGFTSVKIKAAAEDDVVGIVQAIKSVGGLKTPVVIDPNRRFYRLSEALAIAEHLEGFENVMFEDPFPFNVSEWRMFRQKSKIPLVLSGVNGATEHCCDHLNLAYPCWRFLGDAHLAWRLGMLCWHGSGVELGVLDAYILHCSAAARSCVLPGDAIGHRIRSDDLIEEELIVRNGSIQVPSRPGLGVTLDHTALERFAKNRWEITR